MNFLIIPQVFTAREPGLPAWHCQGRKVSEDRDRVHVQGQSARVPQVQGTAVRHQEGPNQIRAVSGSKMFLI